MGRSICLGALVALVLAGCGEVPIGNAGTAVPDQRPPAGTGARPGKAAQAAPTGIDLDETIAFSNPAQCQPASVFRRVLDRMLVIDEQRGSFRLGGPIALAGLAGPITPHLTATRSTDQGLRMTEYVSSLSLPRDARWHGLRLRSIAVSYLDVEESDDQKTTSLEFLEPPDTVRRVLNRRGFGIPAAPGYSELHDDACGGSMEVVAIPGGAALQCGYGC